MSVLIKHGAKSGLVGFVVGKFPKTSVKRREQ
jgi:hypothetical protein